MNANSPFRSLLANRYGAEAACLCVCGVCANTAQPDCGIEVRSNKTHPISEKRESQKDTGQVELDGIAQSKCGLLSPGFFSVDLKVSGH